jgi:hypothetical protein
LLLGFWGGGGGESEHNFILQRELGPATKVALDPKPVNLEKEIYQQQMWDPKNEVWISQVLNVFRKCVQKTMNSASGLFLKRQRLWGFALQIL